MLDLFDRLAPVIVAPFIGSFLGVVIRRWPAGSGLLTGLVSGRSRCEGCGRALRPHELIPIVSAWLQRGCCRRCGGAIAPAHWWIELAATAIAAWASITAGSFLPLWLTCVLGWVLLALAWIDWEHLRLPDALTLPLLIAGLLATWLLDPESAPEHAVAAVLGFASFWLLSAAYRLLRRREGLGAGDAKLLAAGGAWIGLTNLPLVIAGAGISGLLLAAAWRIAGREITAATPLPFGPGLCAAIWLAWLYAGD